MCMNSVLGCIPLLLCHTAEAQTGTLPHIVKIMCNYDDSDFLLLSLWGLHQKSASAKLIYKLDFITV